MKKYYYICVCIGDYLDCYEDNAYYYSQIGNLQEVNAGEELKTLAPNEIWKRITEDEYNKALANDNYVINYDSIYILILKLMRCINHGKKRSKTFYNVETF